jgi:hypothetical protein
MLTTMGSVGSSSSRSATVFCPSTNVLRLIA